MNGYGAPMPRAGTRTHGNARDASTGCFPRELIMRFMAIATDYDNTLASGGTVAPDTWDALERLRASGRQLLLVTGRELDDLRAVCGRLDIFDRVVAENGGVLFDPATGDRRLLAPAPPAAFVDALRARAVSGFSVSQTLIATLKPNDRVALDLIRELGLELHIVFNGDAVMICAPGVTKGSGLFAALDELQLSAMNVVGVGDAENDHHLLRACGCAVAVGNALASLKQTADLVLEKPDGAGIVELVDALLADDLRSRTAGIDSTWVLLGERSDAHSDRSDRSDTHGGAMVRLPIHGITALLAGPSGSGKSTVATALGERIVEAGFQLCVVDPEGDWEADERTVVIGDIHQPPACGEAMQLLQRPTQNVVVNLLRVPAADRPHFCASLLSQIQQLRLRTGRPHWLVFDEAHHLFPSAWQHLGVAFPESLDNVLAITVHPEQLALPLLRSVDTVLAVGPDPRGLVDAFCRASGTPACHRDAIGSAPLARGEALLWRPDDAAGPMRVLVRPGRVQHRRHRRKYAEGLLIPERSFYFRGPHGALNLRAHNLLLFVELAEGVDDDTWRFHLQRGDYSRWFEEAIDDAELAADARRIEREAAQQPAGRSRMLMREAIERRYAPPEDPSLPVVQA
jgi:hydroxymethylpyrimidine pyrophosphatase-like HAD family hydrolase